MEVTRRKLLKMLSNMPLVLFGLRGIKMLCGKCRFWFEFIKHPAWGGGHWQLFKAPGEQIPILVGLYPLHPLTCPSFNARKPTPGEIGTYVARRITLDMSRGDLVKLTQLLTQSIEYQFRTELVPGARLEIYDGTFLCAKMESILGRAKVLA